MCKSVSVAVLLVYLPIAPNLHLLYDLSESVAIAKANDVENFDFVAQSVPGPPPNAVLAQRSFALYALSQGRGLTEAGHRALVEFRDLLRNLKASGQVIQVVESRIGIEGETKICAKFATGQLAEQAWTQMITFVREGNLVQLKSEECE
jgi:hypothetical protein